MDWFLYDNGLRHERVNYFRKKLILDVLQGSEYASLKCWIKIRRDIQFYKTLLDLELSRSRAYYL